MEMFSICSLAPTNKNLSVSSVLLTQKSNWALSKGTVVSNPLRVKIKEFTEESGKMSPRLTTIPSAKKDDILKQDSSWRWT